MKLLKSLVSRIRWNVVISIIAVFMFMILVLFFFHPFSGNLSCSNGVCIETKLEPDQTSLKGGSTLLLEVKNRGKEDLIIDIELKTKNRVLYFKDTKDQEIGREVELGSGESMTLDFDIAANATYAGTYGIDVTASHNDKEITDDIYLKVA